MSTKEEQCVLNKYIEGLEPALRRRARERATLDAKFASNPPLYRTLPSEKCPVDSSRERNRGVSAESLAHSIACSPVHIPTDTIKLTSSLKPTPTRIRKTQTQFSSTAATSLLMEVGLEFLLPFKTIFNFPFSIFHLKRRSYGKY